MRRRIALAALLSACSGEPAPAEPELTTTPSSSAEPLALAAVPTFNQPGGSPVGFTSDDDVDAFRQRAEEMRDAVPLLIELKGAMSNATDWRVAESTADRLVPVLPERMRLSARRDSEQQLVYRLNSLPTLDPDALGALTEHAQSLARLGSGEGDDILRALIRLDGHIDESLRADIAETAARHLGAAFTARAECVGCTVEEALDGMWPATRASMDPLLYDMQTVHRELVRISRDGTPMP